MRKGGLLNYIFLLMIFLGVLLGFLPTIIYYVAYYPGLKSLHDSDVYHGDCLEFFWDVVGVKGLGSKLLPNLSSGQKQLVQLMQGLCRVSKIKVLDEAFSHLDPVNVDAVGSYIARELKADVVLSIHVPEEAEWLGEYFIVLRDGRVAWRGTLEDLARENIYEVYVRGHVPEGLEVVASLGYVALVRASEDVLFELNSRGVIRGFRKAGVRVYYAGRA